MEEYLICVSCGYLEKKFAYQCSMCGGILYHAKERLLSAQAHVNISLGEGNIPLIPMLKSETTVGIKKLYVKCEFMNPTGSFKDRGMVTAIEKATELGIKKIIAASAGNAGAAAAAYGSRAGFPVSVIVPESTSPEKVRQAVEYGAKVISIKGNYSDSFQEAKELAKNPKWYNVTTTYINPYLWSGYENICYELVKERRNIHWIIVPIGAGPLLGALYHGFINLKTKGIIKTIPRLAGVQSIYCCPIVQAFSQNSTIVKEWNMTKNTIASGLNDELKGYTRDGEYTLSCIYASNGKATAVSDEEIIEARRIMGKEGLYVEPAAAAPVAAAKKMFENGSIKKEETVVVIATGSGLKSSPQKTERIMQMEHESAKRK